MEFSDGGVKITLELSFRPSGARAGIQETLTTLDPGLRRDDGLTLQTSLLPQLNTAFQMMLDFMIAIRLNVYYAYGQIGAGRYLFVVFVL